MSCFTKTGCTHQKTISARLSRDIPVPPSRNDITIKKTNGMLCVCNEPFNFWSKRVAYIQSLVLNFEYMPNEIWLIILKCVMYLEKMECCEYHDWFLSPYNCRQMPSIQLRNRQLYHSNIKGIVLNEGLRIIKMSESLQNLMLSGSTSKLKIKKRSLSHYFLTYILRWYHWLNRMAGISHKYAHLSYELKSKTSYFVNELRKELKQNYYETYVNFKSAEYFTNTYYPNYLYSSLTYFDIDFEYYIFNRKYYNKVYRKSMMLRNGKRINMFLHN